MPREYRVYYQDEEITTVTTQTAEGEYIVVDSKKWLDVQNSCLLYTSPSPRDS